MGAAGYEARPSVLEREFNTRHWGKPMTLPGVRRWLMGEAIPGHTKLLTLAEWLKVPAHELAWGKVESTHASEQQKLWHPALGYQDRELFEIYLRLPIPKRRLAREMILAIARAHEAEEAARASKP